MSLVMRMKEKALKFTGGVQTFRYVLYIRIEFISPRCDLVFSAGGAALLQPDHHAAADAGVFPAAPAERRRGEREAVTGTPDTLEQIKSKLT